MQPMKFFDPPPVRYMGSKWQLADWITSSFPPHVSCCEPFCGGAAVFFRKQPSKIEILNDLNQDVVNFFAVLRTRSDELVNAIELTPWSRVEYDRSFEPSEDPLERARRFYVRSYQAFGSGGVAKKTGWRFQRNESRGTSVAHEWSRLKGLWAAAMRLKNAQIECLPALEVIERFDTPRTLFYVDPPYVFSTRERKTPRYVHEMKDEEHTELAAALHQVKGMVVLSGYDSPLYQELYPDWRRLTKTTTTNGNSQAVESLWISPKAADMSNLPLFKEGEI